MSDAPSDQPKVIEEGADNEPASLQEVEQKQAAKDFSTEQLPDQPSMEVKVASPFTTYFAGRAFSVSGVNATGPFDVLPKHHNFISLLEPCTLIIRATKGDEQKIDISGGLMHVKADNVIVFLDI